MTTSVGISTNKRNRFLHLVLHHLNPPSLDRNLTRKGNIGKNTKCSKGKKGCGLKHKLTKATMDYSFFSLQCIQGIPYIELQKGNGGLNLSDLKAYGRPRLRYLESYEEKSKNIWTYAHIQMYAGLR